MKYLLLFILFLSFSAMSQKRKTINVFVESTFTAITGKFGSSKLLNLPNGTSLPTDYKTPKLNGASTDLGIRFNVYTAKKQPFSVSVCVPFQFSYYQLSGASVSSNSDTKDCFGLGIPILGALNFGLGSKMKMNSRFGFNIGGGLSWNKAFLSSRDIKFNDGSTYNYSYNSIMSFNVFTGIKLYSKSTKKVYMINVGANFRNNETRFYTVTLGKLI